MSAKQPTKLGYCLLGLVALEPRSGYELRKVFEETAMGGYSSSPGAIYPALGRLEEDGWIVGEEERPTSLRPRKVYEITPAGDETLHEWLARPITREDVSRALDELMLRFAFHSLLDDAEATRRFLEELAGEIDAYVRDLEAQRQHVPETPPHGRLALAAGIAQYRAAARWARKARACFPEGSPSG